MASSVATELVHVDFRKYQITCKLRLLIMLIYFVSVQRDGGVTSYGARAPSTFKSESQLSNYCVVCEISWCRCQQLTALLISTALVTKLLVIDKLLHPALKSTVSAPWPTFNLCPSSQQILATPLQRDRNQWRGAQPVFRLDLASGHLMSFSGWHAVSVRAETKRLSQRCL